MPVAALHYRGVVWSTARASFLEDRLAVRSPRALLGVLDHKPGCGLLCDSAMQVSERVVQALLTYAKSRGLARAELLSASQLEDEALEPVDERLPATVVYDLHRGISALTGSETWALEVVNCLPKGAYGLAEYIFRCQARLLESLRAVVHYFSLLSEITQLDLLSSGQGMVFHAEHRDSRVVGSTVDASLYQNLLSAVLHVAREVTSTELTPELVTLPFQSPRDRSPYARVFGCDVQFQAERAALHFGAESLAVPIRAADQNLASILEGHADELLERMSHADEHVAAVRRMILKQLHGRDTSLETVAQMLKLSPRSLQRKLGAVGHTYSELLAEMRYQMARRCLTQTHYSMDELAFLLGYSDTSAFVKAFRRWAGVTPGQYRSDAGQASGSS